MKTIAAIALFTALMSGAHAQTITAPSTNPTKPVTLAVGELQATIASMMADARAQDAHQRAAVAFAKISKQIEPEPPKAPEKERTPPGNLPATHP